MGQFSVNWPIFYTLIIVTVDQLVSCDEFFLGSPDIDFNWVARHRSLAWD